MIFFSYVQTLVRNGYDAFQIFFSFSRKPYHEVKFYRVPAALERLLYGGIKILVSVALVYNLSEPFRSRLRRKRKASGPSPSKQTQKFFI